MVRKVKGTDSALARTNRPVNDGLQNLVAGLGTSADKRTHNQYGFARLLTRVELENMYRDSWLAKRIVNSVADDMTRAGWTVSFDDNTPEAQNAIEQAYQRFDIYGKFNEGLKWSRLYGGAIGVIGVGREDLSKPLNLETIAKGSLRYIHILDRWRVSASSDLCLDLDSPNFGKPNAYMVAESSVMVHYTRVLRFDGEKLPYFLWQQNGRWDDSVLQHTFQAISDSDQNTAAIGTMMFEANIDVVTSENLADALATDQGTELVRKRYAQANLMKSYSRMLLLDGTEKHDKKTNSFANLDKILEKFMLCVCGAADIPATRLFGMSPAGMSATGESDIRNYYDRISAAQESDLHHSINYLNEIIARSELGYLPKNLTTVFNPLWQISATEQATIDKTRAETDQIYLQEGVVTEGTVARELKERGVYPNMTDEEIEMAEALALAPPEPPPPLPGAAPNPDEPVKKDIDPKAEEGTMQIPPVEGESVKPKSKPLEEEE